MCFQSAISLQIWYELLLVSIHYISVFTQIIIYSNKCLTSIFYNIKYCKISSWWLYHSRNSRTRMCQIDDTKILLLMEVHGFHRDSCSLQIEYLLIATYGKASWIAERQSEFSPFRYIFKSYQCTFIGVIVSSLYCTWNVLPGNEHCHQQLHDLP